MWEGGGLGCMCVHVCMRACVWVCVCVHTVGGCACTRCVGGCVHMVGGCVQVPDSVCLWLFA